jgi:TonB family protein
VIASWMAYAALVSGSLTVAGVALERMASGRGWPRRWIWIAVLIGSIAWPVGSAIRDAMPQRKPVVLMPFVISVNPTQAIVARTGLDRAELIDRGLMLLWGAASVLFLLRLGTGVFGLRRTRDAWRRGEIDGTPVRLSANVGPAVIGLRSMEVVLPEWIVSLDAPLRALVLRHEEEHRRARDPYALFAAALAVAAMPWNVALWFQARRLRLAIEMDCDARVLRAHPTPERYGLLMLTIAQRRSLAPALFAPMLSEPTTQLERRILAMRTPSRLTRATLYGGSAIALAVVAFACSLQTDNPMAPTTANKQKAGDSASSEFQVSKKAAPIPGNPAPRYPDLLRQARIEGEVLAQFIVNADGSVDMSTFKVLKTSHDLFTATVRNNLPQMRFSPAQVNGRNVRQLMQMPFTFGLVGGSAPDTSRGAVAVTGVPSPAGNPEQAKIRRVEGVAPTQLTGGAYFEYQVERAVSPIPGNPSPRYPDTMRHANIEGEVLAQFIVEENGRPNMDSFKVLKSSDTLFTNAVRSSLPNMKFYAAQVGGRPVRQIVQMPFQFSLTKD